MHFTSKFTSIFFSRDYASLVPNIHLPTPQLKMLAHHVSGETIKVVAAYLFAYEAGVIIGLKILIF